MKNTYPNKLTDCQKQTKNPHFYWGEGKKTKWNENKSKVRALLVSIFCLDTEAVNPWRSTKYSDPLLVVLRSSVTCSLACFVFNDTYNGLNYIPVLRLVSDFSKPSELMLCILTVFTFSFTIIGNFTSLTLMDKTGFSFLIPCSSWNKLLNKPFLVAYLAFVYLSSFCCPACKFF